MYARLDNDNNISIMESGAIMLYLAEKYKKFYEMAKKAGAKYPELVAAQFALESGYGKYMRYKNTACGIKKIYRLVCHQISNLHVDNKYK